MTHRPSKLDASESSQAGSSVGANPYASPKSEDEGRVTVATGPAWGILFGPIHGSTFGVFAGVSLAIIVTIFYAVTRLPGWFGPSDGMLIRLLLYFGLAGMVGGVAGMAVGAVGGAIVGLSSRWSKTSLHQTGAVVFGMLGGGIALFNGGRSLGESDSSWKLLPFGAAIVVATLYAAAAGRRTGLSIQSKLQRLESDHGANDGS